MLIRSKSQAARLDVGALPVRPEPRDILMVPPEHYEVKDVKNPWMRGHQGGVDRAAARAQWEGIKRAFESLGRRVHVLPAAKGLEDMTFCANQAVVGFADDGRYALMSRMKHPSRRREVKFFRQWFSARDYRILELRSPGRFLEGHGDAVWHPGRRLLWGGYGQRSSRAAHGEVSRRLRVPVVLLRLPTAEFYHLDTCFCPLDEGTVLVHPQGLTASGMLLARSVFKRIIIADPDEARRAFVCNSVCLDGTVVAARGAPKTAARLRAAGYRVLEVEAGEFLKSGGGPFCLKTMVYGGLG